MSLKLNMHPPIEIGTCAHQKAHTRNQHGRGRQKDHEFKIRLGQVSETLSQKQNTRKRTLGIAQVLGPWFYPQHHTHTHTHTHGKKKVCFLIAENWKQSTCLSTLEQINKYQKIKLCSSSRELSAFRMIKV
jgi:hypothetical protein